MSNKPPHGNPSEQWARLRFSIVGPLLSCPAKHGQLKEQLGLLSYKEWIHPTTGQPVHFSFSTIERWYYRARASTDPVGILRRKSRCDLGAQRSLAAHLKQALRDQYQRHPNWSMRLHYDNLAALAEAQSHGAPMVSYATVVRYMKAHGLTKHKRRGPRHSPGAALAQQRFESRETRSFEVEYVNGLWHLDFHHASRKVLLRSGQWAHPILLGILDDCSRLVCHAQWYLAETAENLIHGLCQALQKRGLPRALMTDNGPAMLAAETTQGLHRLSIVHEKTLPYSPNQNGKQEVFWAQVEGRLMAMLEGWCELTLGQLNEATVAWAELEYNRKVHSETGHKPMDRFVMGEDVGRPSPPSEALRQAFTAQERRLQRRSDATISLRGVRFELPSRYRMLREVCVRYVAWDLSRAFLADGRTGEVLCRIYPLDKVDNAGGQRRVQSCPAAPPADEAQERSMAPLLKKLIADYTAAGLAPAYLPKQENKGGKMK